MEAEAIHNISGNVSGTLLENLITETNFPVIIVYSVLFVVAAIGNLTVFSSLYRSRHRKSRISLMIKHLAIADLIVTFIMIPIEVGWRITDRWIAGNVACKVVLFLRVFGPYLSSNVLVCISLDRYFAVLHPLKVNDARRRGKMMLGAAWGAAFVYCIPQAFVFSVMTHPRNPHYTQCVSFDFFTSASQEIAYNFLCVTFMYFIPLLVIVVAYTAIMREISRTSKSNRGESYAISGRMTLRRSDMSNIARTRSRTLRMTITIVAVYIWCCTPYVIITLWYMLDRRSAVRLPKWLQDTFFMMVVSNSCMNPIVYGSYAINCRENYCYRFNCLKNEKCGGNDGDKQMNDGHRLITRRIMKCFLGLKKVGSGATRTTGMAAHALTGRGKKLVHQNGRLTGSFEKDEKPSSADRPPSAARVSFSDSSSSCSRSQNFSFHSEPLKAGFGLAAADKCCCVSEPARLSAHSNFVVSIDLSATKVRYHRGGGRSVSIMTRNM